MTNENMHLFLKELIAHCERLNAVEFDFIVEHWGVMWTPWFINIANENVNFTITHLEAEDFKQFVDNKIMTLVKEYRSEELDDLEIAKTTFKLVK